MIWFYQAQWYGVNVCPSFKRETCAKDHFALKKDFRVLWQFMHGHQAK